MRIITKPTKNTKHYMTWQGANHLGACHNALEKWRRDYGEDHKFEASETYKVFKTECPACFATEVLRYLNRDSENDLPDKMIIKADINHADPFCLCGVRDKSKRKMSKKNQKRLEYLMRCIIETCATNSEQVKAMNFGRLG